MVIEMTGIVANFVDPGRGIGGQEVILLQIDG